MQAAPIYSMATTTPIELIELQTHRPGAFARQGSYSYMTTLGP